jgi:short chain dehydrogenase
MNELYEIRSICQTYSATTLEEPAAKFDPGRPSRIVTKEGLRTAAFESYLRDRREGDLMKRAIVIGASSGIGKELATVLSQNGFAVGIMARRIDLLEELRARFPMPHLQDKSIFPTVPAQCRFYKTSLRKWEGLS